MCDVLYIRYLKAALNHFNKKALNDKINVRNYEFHGAVVLQTHKQGFLIFHYRIGYNHQSFKISK